MARGEAGDVVLGDECQSPKVRPARAHTVGVALVTGTFVVGSTAPGLGVHLGVAWLAWQAAVVLLVWWLSSGMYRLGERTGDRPRSSARRFAVAPAIVLAGAAVGASGLLADARWALSVDELDAFAAEAGHEVGSSDGVEAPFPRGSQPTPSSPPEPPPASPVVVDREVGIDVEVPRWIGLYPVHDARRYGATLVIELAFTSSYGGFACGRAGPGPVHDAVVAYAESIAADPPEVQHREGCWFEWSATW